MMLNEHLIQRTHHHYHEIHLTGRYYAIFRLSVVLHERSFHLAARAWLESLDRVHDRDQCFLIGGPGLNSVRASCPRGRWPSKALDENTPAFFVRFACPSSCYHS